MYKIYLLPITSTYTSNDSCLLPFVSDMRKGKVLSYESDANKKESLYAALLLQMKLCQDFYLKIKTLEFDYTESHKPYLLTAPTLHFNLSHTKGMIACAIGTSPIGVDIEQISLAPFEAMSEFFSKEESDYVIHPESVAERNLRFFYVWTRKQAKCKYKGIDLQNKANLIDSTGTNFSPYCRTNITEDYCLSSYIHDKFDPDIVSVSEKEIQNYYKRLIFVDN